MEILTLVWILSAALLVESQGMVHTGVYVELVKLDMI